MQPEIIDNRVNKIGDGIPRFLKYSPNQFNLNISAGGLQYDFGGAITQGIAAIQRVGDRININRVDGRLHMVVADTTNLMRVCIIYVKGYDIGGSFTNFFANGTSGSPDVTSQFQPYGRGQAFEVMYDRTFNLCAQASNTQIVADFSCYVNRPIAYQPASPVSLAGNLYLIAMSDSSVAPHPLLAGTTRLYFSDL